MATGKRSGVLVLDLDFDLAKGLDGIAAAAELGQLPDSHVIRTPRGGLHCYFRCQKGLGNSRGALPIGIDVRGEGGYVILPPSRRNDGVTYTWAEPPGHCELAEPPAWLLKQKYSKPAKAERPRSVVANTEAGHVRGDYAHAALEQECAAVANAVEGTRNETLNRTAFALGQLVAGGALDEQIVCSRLLAAADACGLDRGEADKTIGSGLAAGAKEPRGVPEAKRQKAGDLKPFQDDLLTSAGFEFVEAHDYKDTNGQLLYQTLRYEHPCGAERMLMRRPGPPARAFSGSAIPGWSRCPTAGRSSLIILMGPSTFVKAWAHIAESPNCAVMLVHHTVKPHGDALTVDQSRGASALLAAVRSARVVNTMSKAEAEQATIPAEARRQYFRADLGKVNMMRAVEEADWFKVITVELLNNLPLFGDEVSVVTPWTYPKVDVPNPTAYQEIECLKAIRNGGPWRFNQQARTERWVGLSIMDSLKVDPDNKLVRKGVVQLIKKWIELDHLKVVEREDRHREKSEYVEVGDAAVNGSAAVQEGAKGD